MEAWSILFPFIFVYYNKKCRDASDSEDPNEHILMGLYARTNE